MKGDEYEKFVAEHFRKEGYYVWEHGQEKGKQDGGIDLFIKKGKDTYFVQCKNWENWKINHDTVQAVQTKVRNYMTENPNLTKLLNGNSKKILYVMPKPLLTKSAYAYIKTQPEILDFRIIPMP
ncbi:restriction endonuclease [bacterium]|nr:restriction endonuclease [bacterium]